MRQDGSIGLTITHDLWGLHGTVLPVLHRTVGWDGSKGLINTYGLWGTPQDSPTCPT